MAEMQGDAPHLEDRIQCRRCLLGALPQKEIWESVQRAVEGLDPEVRAEEGLYRERLSRCKECDHLINGTCALCGCFVELRAAIRTRKCPQVPPRWTRA